MADDLSPKIRVDIDTTSALESIKALQRQISAFHQSMQSSGNAANAAMSQSMQRNLISSINATKQFSASLTTVSSTTESFTNALEKNKLSMGQYFKFAGGSTRTFGRLFKNEFNTIEKVARERTKTLQTQFIKMGRDANGAIQAIKVRPLALDMNNLGTQVTMVAQKQQIFNQLLKQGSTNLLNFGKNTQWAGRQLMVGFTVPLTIMGGVAVKEFQKIEEQIVKFRRVYGDMFNTDAETEKAIDDVRRLAEEFTKYGIAVEKTIGLAAKVAQMGNTGKALEQQVIQATRLSVLGGLEQEEALDTTISLTSAFGLEVEDLANKINFLNAAENQTILSIEDFNEAVPKAGSVVRQLGGSVEDLAFFLTAMREGGINASQGANALKTSLARLISPTEAAQKRLGEMGIDVLGIVEANAGDLKGTVLTLARSLDTLDPLTRARAIEQLFGKFQFARMSTMFSNIVKEGSQANKVLQLATATSEELAVVANRELKAVEDSPAFKLQKSIEQLQAALAPIGEEFARLIIPVLEVFNKILKGFNNLDDGVKSFVTGAIVVLGALAPTALMIFGLIANGAANVIKGFAVLRNFFLGLSNTTFGVARDTQYMTNEQLEAAAVAASLGQSHAQLTQIFSSEVAAIQNLINAYNSATSAMGAFNAAGVVTRATPVTKIPGQRTVPGYANGIFSVPGPKGAGDIVPAMLSPGEAVIPADKAQKYGGLIKGIIAGSIPGYSRGLFEETHVANPMPMTNDVIQAVDQLERGFSTLTPQLREAFIVLSDLTATKSRTLNQQAKGAGLSRAEFEEEWNKNSGEGFKKVAGRAQAAGQMGSGQEIDQAIEQLDVEIGARIADRIDNGNIDKSVKGWLDELMADVTQTVIQEFATSGNEARQEVAAGLSARAATPASLRTRSVQDLIDPETGQRYGSADTYFNRQIERGNAELRETAGRPQVFAADSEFSMPIGRTKSSGVLRTNSAAPSRYSGKVLGGTYENPRIPETSEGLVRPVENVRLDYLSAEDAKKDAAAYSDTLAAEIESKSQDPYMYARDRNSPHSFANPDGAEDARAYREGLEGASPGPINFNAKYSGSRPPEVPPVSDPFAPPSQTPAAPPGFEQFVNPAEDFSPPPEVKRSIRDGIGSMFSGMASSIKEQGIKKAKQLGEAAIAPLAKTIAKGTGHVLVSEHQKENYMYDSDTGITTDMQGNVLSMEEESLELQEDAFKTRKERIAAERAKDKEDRDILKKAKAQSRQKLAGRLGMLGAVASVGAGFATQMGGPVGDIAQQVMPIVLAISTIGPLLLSLSGPIALLVVAIGALAFGFFKYNQELNKIRKESRELAESLSAGSKAMGRFAEFAGKATPTEIMQQRRQGLGEQINVQIGKSEFATQFIASKQGEEFVKTVEDGIATLGRTETISRISNQLASAVAGGILSTEQASSIALELGKSIDDYGFSIGVLGDLQSLFGPNGENLLEGEPLQLSIVMSERSISGLQSSFATAIKSMSGESGWLGNFLGFDKEKIAAFAGGSLLGFFEEQQQQLDAFEVSYGKQIDEALQNAQRLRDAGKTEEANEEFLKVDQLRNKLVSERVQLQDQFNRGIRQALDLVGTGKVDPALKEYENMTFDEIKDKISSENLGLDPAEVEAQASRIFGRVAVDGTAVLQAMSDQVKDRFEGASDEIKNLVGGALDVIRKDSDIDIKTKVIITSALGAGALDPATLGVFMDMFAEGPQERAFYMSVIADVGMRMGTGGIQQVSQIIDTISSYIDDELESKAAVANLLDFIDLKSIDNAEGGLNRILDTLTMMSTYASILGGADAINAFIQMDQKSMKNLYDQLDAMQMLVDQSVEPIKIETLIEQKILVDEAAISAFRDNAEYFEKLEPVQQFLYVQTFLSVVGTITDDAARAELVKSGVTAEGPRFASADDARAGRASQNFTPAQLDEARKKIANRIAESVTSIPSMFGETGTSGDDGGGSGTDPFENILTRLKQVRDASINAAGGAKELLRVLGGKKKIDIFEGIEQQLVKFGTEFAGYVSGLDQDTQKLFVTFKKGVPTLTEVGKAMQKAFVDTAIGDFQLNLVQSLEALRNKRTALNTLVENGMAYADALKLATNETIALAIATGTIDTKELEEIVRLVAELRSAEEVEGVLDDVNKEINDFIQDLSTKQKVKLKYEPLSATAILNDETLKAMVRLGLEGSEAFAARLNQVINSIEFNESIFEDGFSKAMEAFAAQETALEIEFEFKTKADQDIITQAQRQIATINYEIDDLEAELTRIEDQEDDINKEYDKRLEALDEIQKANDRVAKQQKTQLTLADALSQGDIAAAARAAQEARQEEAQQALQDQRESLERTRQRQLDALVGNSGKTRIELEESIKDLKTQIFNIEEDTLEPAERRVELAKQELEDSIKALRVAGLSRSEWNQLKNQIDLAKTSSTEYTTAIELAKSVVKDIVDYWNGLDGRIIRTTHEITTVHVGAGTGSGGGTSTGSGDNDGSSTSGTTPTSSDPSPSSSTGTRTGGITLDTKPIIPTGGSLVGNIIIAPITDAEKVPMLTTNEKVAELNKNVPSVSKIAQATAAEVIKTPIKTEKPKTQPPKTITTGTIGGTGRIGLAAGGMVSGRYAMGGIFKSINTDTVPAMLTPGEFVVRRFAVEKFGVENLRAINSGSFKGGSVYNYNLSVNVKSESNPDQIARTVMAQIKQVDAQRIRSSRF